uniref:Phorbol-ester/DAG-type domain-containing protein n=1 Tax=Heterorhabditis bacteriophora TaxID=37862 RepID=A0A1I7XPV4_HETBA
MGTGYVAVMNSYSDQLIIPITVKRKGDFSSLITAVIAPYHPISFSEPLISIAVVVMFKKVDDHEQYSDAQNTIECYATYHHYKLYIVDTSANLNFTQWCPQNDVNLMYSLGSIHLDYYLTLGIPIILVSFFDFGGAMSTNYQIVFMEPIMELFIDGWLTNSAWSRKDFILHGWQKRRRDTMGFARWHSPLIEQQFQAFCNSTQAGSNWRKSSAINCKTCGSYIHLNCWEKLTALTTHDEVECPGLRTSGCKEFLKIGFESRRSSLQTQSKMTKKNVRKRTVHTDNQWECEDEHCGKERRSVPNMSDSVIPMVCTQVAESLLSIFTIGPPALKDEAFQLMDSQNSSEFARDVELAIHKFFRGNSRKSLSTTCNFSYPSASVELTTHLFSENDLFSDSSTSAFSDDEFSSGDNDITSTVSNSKENMYEPPMASLNLSDGMMEGSMGGPVISDRQSGRVLAIAGCTNSGKTTIANLLTNMFSEEGATVEIVHQDDYYLDKEKACSRSNYVIVEGNMITEWTEILDLCDRVIFLTLNQETCRRRRALRCYDPPDVDGYFDDVVWPAYQRHLQKALAIAREDRRISFLDVSSDSDQPDEDLMLSASTFRRSWFVVALNHLYLWVITRILGVTEALHFNSINISISRARCGIAQEVYEDGGCSWKENGEWNAGGRQGGSTEEKSFAQANRTRDANRKVFWLRQMVRQMKSS